MNNSNFSLASFQWIEDIIFLDEPILSHYKKNNREYLLYLVDTVKDRDIFLFFEVEESFILDYLQNKVSLKNLIIQNKDIMSMIEQDFEGNTLNASIVDPTMLNENYLPRDNSYLNFEPTESSYYFKLIEEYNNKLYLKSLKQNAFYLKFNANSSKYKTTIGFGELVNNLLTNVTNSYKHFLEADFKNNFKQIYTDTSKLNRLFNKIRPDLDFRVVDLNFSSFEVGLAVDKLMKTNIEDKPIQAWAKSVGNKYFDIVLDEDYDDETTELILKEFDVADRIKIFSPIFKITEDPNYTFQVKDSINEKYNSIKIRDKYNIEKITPPVGKTNNLEKNKDLEVIQVTTIRDRNKKSKSIRLDETLFSTVDTSVITLTNEHFLKYNYELSFDVTIPLEISSEGGKIKMLASYKGEKFQHFYSSDKVDEGMKKIVSMIYEFILNTD
jgi:hypothetical protein